MVQAVVAQGSCAAFPRTYFSMQVKVNSRAK
jgi:hypothetical protein